MWGLRGYWAIFWGAFLLRLRIARPKKESADFFCYRQQWNEKVARGFGFRFKTQGPATPPGTLIVSTHSGFADINALLCTLPVQCKPHFISKIEIGRIPFFGWHLQYFGDILFDRNDKTARKNVIEQVMTRLEQGFSVVLFPEGTRSKTGHPKKQIHPALIEHAIARNLPIQPVAIIGTSNLIEHPFTLPKSTIIAVAYGEIRKNYGSAVEVWDKVLGLWSELESY